jgi:hypothetical protein
MAILVQSSDPGRKEPPPRLREDLKQRHQRATPADELRAMLDALGLTPRHAARIFAVGPRSIRRWQDGARGVPRAVTLVCRLMAVGAVTIAQVEQAAVPSPIWTNGGAEEKPPAPLHAESAPKQSALASRRARTAARADPGPTTTVVEQVCALASDACRWPYGDPRDRNFRFCGKPTVTGSYCGYHHAVAYLPPRPGRGHGVRIVHGRHGRPPIPGSATSASRAPKILQASPC